MKKSFITIIVSAWVLSFSAASCGGGKTPSGKSADSIVAADSDTTQSAKVDSVKVMEAQIAEEQAKGEITKVCSDVIEEAAFLGDYKPYLTPDFRSVLKKMDDYQARTGEIVLDYDPILAAQDMPDKCEPTITSVNLVSKTKAVVEVELWPGHTRKMTVKKIDQWWMVDDVSGEKAKIAKLIK